MSLILSISFCLSNVIEVLNVAIFHPAEFACEIEFSIKADVWSEQHIAFLQSFLFGFLGFRHLGCLDSGHNFHSFKSFMRLRLPILSHKWLFAFSNDRLRLW